MKTSDLDIFLIPGLGDSGPDHWQSRWEAKLPTARRVTQDDWHTPRLADWEARIVAAVEQATKPVVLVAHSLGALAAAHAAPKVAPWVKGAFLVTPPSLHSPALTAIDRAFFDELRPLPFPGVVVASQDDQHASFADARAFAERLGAEFADAGNAGHINAESGHGPWPEGLMRFAGFLRAL